MKLFGFYLNTMYCHTCGQCANFKCSDCSNALYCSKQCQKKDWVNVHHIVCKTISDETNLSNGLNKNPQIYNGRFKLIKKLGQGSFGSVWKAIDRSFTAKETSVVIKFQVIGKASDLETMKKEDVQSFNGENFFPRKKCF